jgi:hypothetical protein
MNRPQSVTPTLSRGLAKEGLPILEAQGSPRELMQARLKQAVVGGSAHDVDTLLAAGCDPDFMDGNGATLLVHAAARGHMEVCLSLLKRGADPHRLDCFGKDASDYARRNGHLDIAQQIASFHVDKSINESGQIEDDPPPRPPNSTESANPEGAPAIDPGAEATSRCVDASSRIEGDGPSNVTGDGHKGPAAPRFTREEIVDRKSKLKCLIIAGKERGYLTADEINVVLGSLGLDADRSATFRETLSEMGIRILDELDANQSDQDALPVLDDVAGSRELDLLRELLAFAPHQQPVNEGLGEALDEALKTLTPTEARILRRHFGLGNEAERCLAEIAGELNLTTELVRMIEARGLRKLRHPSRSERLRSYLDDDE